MSRVVTVHERLERGHLRHLANGIVLMHAVARAKIGDERLPAGLLASAET